MAKGEVVKTSIKVVACAMVSIGGSVWADRKIKEYIDEQDGDIPLLEGICYSAFIGGLDGLAVSMIAGAMCEGIDTWASIFTKVGQALIKA